MSLPLSSLLSLPILFHLAAAKPLSPVSFPFTEHDITRDGYSFLAKLAKSDFYSAFRLSNTRIFPPPRQVVPLNWRNGPSPCSRRQQECLQIAPYNRTLNTVY